MASNYPPGVSGNEPQITGEWPIEQVIDGAAEDIKKANNLVEDVACQLDDQGALPKVLYDKLVKVQNGLADIRDDILNLIPDEPDYEQEHQEALEDSGDPDGRFD